MKFTASQSLKDTIGLRVTAARKATNARLRQAFKLPITKCVQLLGLQYECTTAEAADVFDASIEGDFATVITDGSEADEGACECQPEGCQDSGENEAVAVDAPTFHAATTIADGSHSTTSTSIPATVPMLAESLKSLVRTTINQYASPSDSKRSRRAAQTVHAACQQLEARQVLTESIAGVWSGQKVCSVVGGGDCDTPADAHEIHIGETLLSDLHHKGIDDFRRYINDIDYFLFRSTYDARVEIEVNGPSVFLEVGRDTRTSGVPLVIDVTAGADTYIGVGTSQTILPSNIPGITNLIDYTISIQEQVTYEIKHVSVDRTRLTATGEIIRRFEGHEDTIHVSLAPITIPGQPAVNLAATSNHIVVHGMNSGPDKPNILQAATALKTKAPGDNVLVFGWADGADDNSNVGFQNVLEIPTNLGSAEWIPWVGQYLGQVIKKLAINPQSVNGIGHSMGAFVLHEAGLETRRSSGSKLGSIVSLDAPYSTFNFGPASMSFAEYSTGHVDFSRSALRSWAFVTSVLGDPRVARTATEAFSVRFRSDNPLVDFIDSHIDVAPFVTAYANHVEAVPMYAQLVADSGSGTAPFGSLFDTSFLRTGVTSARPWSPDAVKVAGWLGYEAALIARRPNGVWQPQTVFYRASAETPDGQTYPEAGIRLSVTPTGITKQIDTVPGTLDQAKKRIDPVSRLLLPVQNYERLLTGLFNESSWIGTANLTDFFVFDVAVESKVRFEFGSQTGNVVAKLARTSPETSFRTKYIKPGKLYEGTLKPGRYSVEVTQQNSADLRLVNDEPYTLIGSMTPVPTPLVLQGGVAIQTNGIGLNFSAIPAAAQRVVLERSIGDGDFEAIQTINRSETRFSDTTVAHDTEATYRLVVENADGTKMYSAETTQATLPAVMSSPSNVVTAILVTNTNDAGTGSLRDAILRANQSLVRQVIQFQLPEGSSQTIHITERLPDIVKPVWIVGNSQNPMSGVAGVTLDFSAQQLGSGLVIRANECIVQGLSIINSPGNGIDLIGNSGRIWQCRIGTDNEGRSGVGNKSYGVNIFGHNNIVGGSISGGSNTLVGNVISGNGRDAVFIIGSNSEFNIVENNYIGLDPRGERAIPNGSSGSGYAGVIIYNAPNNTVIGNVISGNNGDGVHVYDNGSNNTVIRGNRIGTTASGDVPLGNSANGIRVQSGKAARIEGNVISANQGHGISLQGFSSESIVTGNLIGTSSRGDLDLGNLEAGISVTNRGSNRIGGTTAADANVISGNEFYGVFVGDDGPVQTTIQGNVIGLDATQSFPISNRVGGVLASNVHDITIGGSAIGSGNMIAGNGGDGVFVFGSNGHDVVVEGNFIGTNRDMAAGLGNTIGVRVGNTPRTLIRGNTIAGNRDDGIYLDGSGYTVGTLISGNFIGIDVSQTLTLPNGGDGIEVSSAVQALNTIGGDGLGEGNVIAGSRGAGIAVLGKQTQIIGNSMFANLGLGIDLGTRGVTPNDVTAPADSDDGANRLLNSPQLSAARLANDTLQIEFATQTAESSATYPLTTQFFVADAEGQEGQTLLGSYTTDTAATESVATLNASGNVFLGDRIVAVTIDADGNTSEFSSAVVISEPSSQVPGSAMKFDGVDDFLRTDWLPESAGLNQTALTLEAWVNPESPAAGTPMWMSVINNGRPAWSFGRGFGLLFDSQTMQWTILVLAQYEIIPISAASIPSEKWSHIAIVYHNNDFKLYVNGFLVGVRTTPSQLLDGSNVVTVGWDGSYRTNGRFRGHIDELRIWNAQQTQDDIVGNMNRTLTGQENGLAALWDFDAGSGNSVSDATPHSFNLGTHDNGTLPAWSAPGALVSSPFVSLSAAKSNLFEGDDSVMLTATISEPTNRDITITLAVSGSATATTDFTASRLQIVILAGSTSGSMTITAVQDSIFEGAESVAVDITSVTNGTEQDVQRQTITIADDDSVPSVTLTADRSSIAEAAGSATITATMTNASSQDVTVAIVVSGSATATTDFTASRLQVIIPAGSASGSLTITALQDAIYEGAESIVIDLDSVANGTEQGVQRQTITIADDDSVPSVTLTADRSSIAEAAGSATVTATLTNALSQDVTVAIVVSGSASATTDFTASRLQVIIPAGSASGSLTITSVQDSLVEGPETIVVDLDSVMNGTEQGVQRQTITITDDDVVAPPVNRAPVIAAQSFSVSENSAVGTLVGSVSASDPDAGQTLSFSITAGNSDGLFAIDSATGRITVSNSGLLDFETRPRTTLTVQAIDNGSPALSSAATVTVNLTDVVETTGERVEVFMTLVDLNGQPGIGVSEQFDIAVSFKDLLTQQSVFSAVTDIGFDATQFRVDGIEYASNFPSFPTGSVDNTNGIVDEVGAVGGLEATPQLRVFTLHMTALKAGTSRVSSNVAESPVSEMVVFGTEVDQRNNTRYGSLELVVGQPDLIATQFMLSPDHVLGGTTTATLIVKNIGDSPAPVTEAKIIWSDDSTLANSDDRALQTVAVPALAAGEEKQLTINLSFDRVVLFNRAVRDDAANQPVGYVSNERDTLFMICDSAAGVSETSEANNSQRGLHLDLANFRSFPFDTNRNGIVSATDAIYVINRIGTTVAIADINGSGTSTAVDAIAVINRLGYSISPADPAPSSSLIVAGRSASLLSSEILTLAALNLELRELDQQPGLLPGEPFELLVQATSIANHAAAFAAFADILFDTSKFRADAIHFDDDYTSLRSGTIDVTGLIDEAGAVGQITPASDGTIFRVLMTAIDSGSSTISTNAAEDVRSETVLYGVDGDIRQQVQQASLTLTVGPSPNVAIELTGSDSVVVSRVGDQLQVLVNDIVNPTYSMLATSVQSIIVIGSSGNNRIDFSAVTRTDFPNLRGSTLSGEAGNDLIIGTDGSDIINAGSGNDTVLGGPGRDSISGAAGTDSLLGGDDFDTIRGGTGNDTIDGGLGNDALNGQDDNDSLIGGDNDDRLNGGTGNDVLDGGLGADTLIGDDGLDTLSGGAGADNLQGGKDNDRLSGGDDADSLDGAFGNDTLEGDNGNDTLRGNVGVDDVDGNAGTDRLTEGYGSETAAMTVVIMGLQMQNSTYGTETSRGIELFVINAGAGNDKLDARSSSVKVQLRSGPGADTLLGSAFADLLNGGDGDDVLSGGASIDAIEGGLGTDFYYEKANANVTITGMQVVSTGTGTETLVGIEQIALVGGDSGNQFNASASSLPLILLGGKGNDTLIGSEFNDVLIGGSRWATPTTPNGDGTDSLIGGSGTDSYDNDPLDSRSTLAANETAIASVFAGLPSWLDLI